VVLAVMSVFSVGIPFVTDHWFEDQVKMPTLADYGAGEEGAAAHAGEAHGVFAITHAHEHAAHLPAMAGSILVAGLGILLAYLTYRRGAISAAAWSAKLRPLYVLFKNKYFFDELYQAVVVRSVLAAAAIVRLFDIYVVDALVNGAGKLAARLAWVAGGVDLFGVDGAVNGLAQTVIGFGRAARKVQTGRIQNYVYGFMGILLVLVFVGMFR
jgi:NADH:ubiquinone oxidoreductase subunit 5 (subunit L)/multisubunit Na+/H+ antiporter MnhA subunit